MRISIRLLMLGLPDVAISMTVRLRRRLPARASEGERVRLWRKLSRSLPPRLLRDVLPH